MFFTFQIADFENKSFRFVDRMPSNTADASSKRRAFQCTSVHARKKLGLKFSKDIGVQTITKKYNEECTKNWPEERTQFKLSLNDWKSQRSEQVDSVQDVLFTFFFLFRGSCEFFSGSGFPPLRM
jgi:hypothetical protein